MHLELGPVPAGDVQQWARVGRRLACELRADPADLEGVATPDLLDSWGRVIDHWSHEAAFGNETFRWSGDMDVEQAAYLLHGIVRFIDSPTVERLVTPEEAAVSRPFTLHVVQALLDGLGAEGECQQHLCDQIRVSLSAQLDH